MYGYTFITKLCIYYLEDHNYIVQQLIVLKINIEISQQNISSISHFNCLFQILSLNLSFFILIPSFSNPKICPFAKDIYR